MNEKKINYYLKKYNLNPNENNYINIINIYNHKDIKYSKNTKYLIPILKRFFGIFLLYLFFSNKDVKYQILKRIYKFKLFIKDYNIKKEIPILKQNNPLNMDSKKWEEFKKILVSINVNMWTNVWENIYDKTEENKQKILRKLKETKFIKNEINKFLPIIIENFNKKAKLRKEILNINREILVNETKLSNGVIDKIIGFIKNIVGF